MAACGISRDDSRRALAAVTSIIDTPDRRASLFVRLCMQNNGPLSKAKRDSFAELTDADVSQLQAAVQRVIREEPTHTRGRVDEDVPALLQQPAARRTASEE